jgi:hypothetical protein
MTASKLEMISAYSELAFYGCTQARNFFSEEQSEEFSDVTKDILKIVFGADFNFINTGLTLFPTDISLRRVEYILSQSHPAMLERYHSTFNVIEDQTRQFFGSGWTIAKERSRYRSVGSKEAMKWRFHCPESEERERHEIVLWVPVHRAPDGVSIDIIAGSNATLSFVDATQRRIYSSPPLVAALGRPYSPVLDPGDIMVCDQFTLYRTTVPHNSAGFTCELAFTWRPGKARIQRAVLRAKKMAKRPLAMLGAA